MTRQTLNFLLSATLAFHLMVPVSAQTELLSIELNQNDQAGFDLWPSAFSGSSSTADFTTDAVATSGTTRRPP